MGGKGGANGFYENNIHLCCAWSEGRLPYAKAIYFIPTTSMASPPALGAGASFVMSSKAPASPLWLVITASMVAGPGKHHMSQSRQAFKWSMLDALALVFTPSTHIQSHDVSYVRAPLHRHHGTLAVWTVTCSSIQEVRR